MTDTVVTAVGIARARPGFETELGRRMAALIAPTRSEPGCIAYELFKSLQDPALWMFLETWRSEADLEAHIGSRHLREFIASAHDVLDGPPQSYRFGPANARSLESISHSPPQSSAPTSVGKT